MCVCNITTLDVICPAPADWGQRHWVVAEDCQRCLEMFGLHNKHNTKWGPVLPHCWLRGQNQTHVIFYWSTPGKISPAPPMMCNDTPSVIITQSSGLGGSHHNIQGYRTTIITDISAPFPPSMTWKHRVLVNYFDMNGGDAVWRGGSKNIWCDRKIHFIKTGIFQQKLFFCCGLRFGKILMCQKNIGDLTFPL